MLDGVGVIHMNGRIYDPQLGRFLQPDPMIQAPFDPQSWNAYTYVFNNPLVYTDPSGMIGVKERQWAAGIIAITAAAFGQYYIAQGAYAAAFAVTTSGAFLSGAVATQSFKGGVYGAFNATLTFGVGAGLNGWQAVLGYAVTGGIVESLQGGNFGNGFAAAGVTALVMPGVYGIRNPGARATVGALVGGTLSELSGGKFANGAVSGAVQAAMAGVRRAASPDGEYWGPEFSGLRELAIREGEQAMEDIRSRRYTDLNELATDTADALQPVTDRRSTEVAVRFFQNGSYFEAGSITSDGQLCAGNLRCGVNPRLSQSLTDGSRVVGYLHTHPTTSKFSGADLAFAWSERTFSGGHQTAYVSRPDGRVYSFNTSVVGTIPNATIWDDYINYANRVR